MSPTTALSVDGGHPAPLVSDLRSLWARLEQVERQDEEKTILLKEIMTRYEFCNEQYQQEVRERRREHETILAWQHDKKRFEGSFRSIQVAMVRFATLAYNFSSDVLKSCIVTVDCIAACELLCCSSHRWRWHDCASADTNSIFPAHCPSFMTILSEMEKKAAAELPPNSILA